jgi:hypothetical protein
MDDRQRDSKTEWMEREELREALHDGVGMRVMPLEGDALEPMCELPSIVAPSGEDAEQALSTGDLLLPVLEVRRIDGSFWSMAWSTARRSARRRGPESSKSERLCSRTA